MKTIGIGSLAVIFISLIASTSSMAQGWVIEGQIDLQGADCFQERATSSSYSYTDPANPANNRSGSATISSSQPFLSTFSFTVEGIPNGTLSASSSGVCDYWVPPLSGSLSGGESVAVNASASKPYAQYMSSCPTYYYPTPAMTPGQSDISLYITYYPRLFVNSNPPVVSCKTVTFSTNGACTKGSHYWEVSDTGAGNWQPLGTGGTSLTVNLSTVQALFTSKFGTFYVKVSDTSLPGRTSVPVSFPIDAPPPTATFSNTNVSCYGGGDATIALTITPSVSAITNYYIRGFHESNNTLSLPAAQWTPDLQIVNGAVSSTATKTHVISGLGGITKGNWSFVIENNTTTATYGACGVTYVNSVTINQPTEVVVNTVTPRQVSCNGAADGQLTASVSGGTGSYTYLWSHPSGTNSNVATGLGPGSYTVKVRDSNGCPSLVSTDNLYAQGAGTITEPAPLTVSMSSKITYGGYDVRCWYEANGGVKATPSGGNGGYSYAWTSYPTVTTSELTDRGPGTYSVTVTDSKGCAKVGSLELKAPVPINFSINQVSTLVCPGDKTDLQATVVSTTVIGSPRYSWSSGGTEALEAQRPAGTYTLTVSDAQGCYTTKPITFADPKGFSVSLATMSSYNGKPIKCNGEANGQLGTVVRDLSVSPPNNIVSAEYYIWFKGTSTASYDEGASKSSLSGLAEGNYKVRVRYRGQCFAESPVVPLNDPDPVDVQINPTMYNGQPLRCYGSTDANLQAVPSGGTITTIGYTYLWNTTRTTSSLPGVGAGTYSVTAKDENGCTGSKSITIDNPDPVLVAIADFSDHTGFGISCTGLSDGWIRAEADGGTGVYTYEWTPTEKNALISNVSAGTYMVIAKDNNGCSSTVSHTLDEPLPLQLSISRFNSVSCYNGSSGAVTLLASEGAKTGYEYSIDNGQSWQSSPIFSGLRAGQYNFKVKDANICAASTLKEITQPAELRITFANVEPAFCADPRGKATAIVTGGVGNYNYRWRDSEGNEISTANAISNVRADIYELDITDANMCPAQSTLPITSTDGAQSTYVATPTKCFNSSDGGAVITINQGAGPFVIKWPDGQTTLHAANLRGQTYNVLITDVNDCAVVQQVSVPSPPALRLDVVNSIQPTCNGMCDGELTLAASGGVGNYTYQWNGANTPRQAALCAKVYPVTITDANSCILNQSVELTQPDSVKVLSWNGTLPTCRDGCDGSIEVNAGGGNGTYRYSWSNGTQERTIDQICPGEYTLIISDHKGCTGKETITLANTPRVPVNLGGGATICVGQKYTLDAGAGWSSQRWTLGNNTLGVGQSIVVNNPGMYILDVVNPQGCPGRDTFLLETSTDLLKASFLMPTNAYVGDTVVFFDISWPLPESIEWNFPESMTKLMDGGYMIYGQFAEAGNYNVWLTAHLGECVDIIAKTITVLGAGTDPEGGRLGHVEFLKLFTLHPNPNNGLFDVEIEMAEVGPVTLSVWSLPRSIMIAKEHDRGDSHYLKKFDLRPLSSGLYVLRVDHARGVSYLRFIVH